MTDDYVFSSTKDEAKHDATRNALIRYLGIDADEWPVCSLCKNKEVIFSIQKPEFFEADKKLRIIQRRSTVSIRCPRCRRKTGEFSDIHEAIREWNANQ